LLAETIFEVFLKTCTFFNPILKKRIGDLTDEYEWKMQELGPEIPEGVEKKKWVMMDVVTKFLGHYNSAIKERDLTFLEEEKLFAVQIASIYEKFSKTLRSENNFLNNVNERIKLAVERSVNIERFTSIEVRI